MSTVTDTILDLYRIFDDEVTCTWLKPDDTTCGQTAHWMITVLCPRCGAEDLPSCQTCKEWLDEQQPVICTDCHKDIDIRQVKVRPL